VAAGCVSSAERVFDATTARAFVRPMVARPSKVLAVAQRVVTRLGAELSASQVVRRAEAPRLREAALAETRVVRLATPAPSAFTAAVAVPATPSAERLRLEARSHAAPPAASTAPAVSTRATAAAGPPVWLANVAARAPQVVQRAEEAAAVSRQVAAVVEVLEEEPLQAGRLVVDRLAAAEPPARRLARAAPRTPIAATGVTSVAATLPVRRRR
jgi:hypothetical protein